jgi:hypothetical protein
MVSIKIVACCCLLSVLDFLVRKLETAQPFSDISLYSSLLPAFCLISWSKVRGGKEDHWICFVEEVAIPSVSLLSSTFAQVREFDAVSTILYLASLLHVADTHSYSDEKRSEIFIAASFRHDSFACGNWLCDTCQQWLHDLIFE